MFGHTHGNQRAIEDCERGVLLAEPVDMVMSVSNSSKMTAQEIQLFKSKDI